MKNRRVLISGAGVAGPALAYWLARHGFAPTVVESAPGLRGGFAVDFRGETHLSVLRKMGVLERLREFETGGSEFLFIDGGGRELARLPPAFTAGDLEVYRADLSRVLYEHSRDGAEYVFSNSITALHQTPDDVEVEFQSGASRTFDLVVGADGMHSNVRRLAFGPEREFVRHLGYYFASWSLPNDLGLDRTRLSYNVPGKLASVAGNPRDPQQAGAFFVFASGPLQYDRRSIPCQQKLIADRFQSLGWHIPRLVEGIASSPDFYLDSISRVDLPCWSRGRVTLLGDAGYGATLGGMGVGLGVVGAYVLAGELAAAEGDYTAAFARYEAQFRDYARRCQKGGGNAGSFLAPRTAFGISLRNRALRSKFFYQLMLRESQKMAAHLSLKAYGSC